MRERVVLDMHRLPNDLVKAALSELTVVRLHGHILKGEQPRELRRLLVFDEAWRVKDSVRLQESAREGRAFGVGIVIGTQFPGDIPDDLSGTLATQLMLGNQSVDHRRSVLLKLVGSTAGPEAQRLLKQLSLLQKHEGYFRKSTAQPVRAGEDQTLLPP
jgi:DNA helicase HerA-like ATPase